MNAGIVSYGAYVPIYRLSRTEIAKVWGRGKAQGEKAVANCDEDTITMAVEAGIDCLKGIDPNTVDGLYFASTTPPYREKKSASIVAAALDLRRDIFAADFGNSLGAGANAINCAMDAVKAGSARNILVVASDCRVPAPRSAFEFLFADGAAALLIGGKDIVATAEGRYGFSSNFLDVWRKEQNDSYVRTWEDRYIVEKGYTAHVKEAVSALLSNCVLNPEDITQAAFYGPDGRSHANMARLLGFGKTQVVDPMFDVLGNTGCAFFMMLIVAALEKAKEGDKLLAASYGDGADAWLFTVTGQIESAMGNRGLARHLSSKLMLPNYGTVPEVPGSD